MLLEGCQPHVSQINYIKKKHLVIYFSLVLTLCELVKKDSLLVVNFANYRDLDSLSLSGYCGLSKVLNKTTPFRPETTIAFRLKDLQQSRLPNILYT
jgi:hypothetical protein